MCKHTAHKQTLQDHFLVLGCLLCCQFFPLIKPSLSPVLITRPPRHLVANIVPKLAHDVAIGVVLAHNVVAKGARRPRAADVAGALPHHLREVARVARVARVVEVVADALAAPDVGPVVVAGPAGAPGDVFAVIVVGLFEV